MDQATKMSTVFPISLVSVNASQVKIVGQRVFLSDVGIDPNLVYSLDGEAGGALVLSVTVFSDGNLRPALYLDYGDGFSEDAKLFPIEKEDRRHRFLIKDSSNLKYIRYDPSDQPCTISIDSVLLRSLGEDEKFSLIGCAITRVEGMTLNPLTGLADVATDDPQIYLAIDDDVKQLPYAIVEIRARADTLQCLDPTLYLGDKQSTAIPLWRDGAAFKALLVEPGRFPKLRLDPVSRAGSYYLTHLTIRPLDAADGHHAVAELYARQADEIVFARQTSILLNKSEASVTKSIDIREAQAEREKWIRSGLEVRSASALADIQARLNRGRQRVRLETGPLISILTPVYNVDPHWLHLMIASIRGQTYTNWELCLVDDCSTDQNVRNLLTALAHDDDRLKVRFRETNGGISKATNDALEMASGSYIALVDNDDVLTCDAIEEMVDAIIANDEPDWLYSDEFKIDQDGRPSQLFAKPDWSFIMLFNYMYTGHLTLYRTELVRAVGAFRSAYDFSQDYDLALRIADRGPRIIHVEKYLYGWRMIEGSGSQGGKPTARLSNIAALQDAADRKGWERTALPLATANRLVHNAPGTDEVSIIIPSDNVDNISASLRSIVLDSQYSNYEIIVVARTNIIEQVSDSIKSSARWVPYDKPYNFSDKCNVGAAAAKGDVLIFFNDDVRVISADWIETLLEVLTIPGVGVAGPKLLYEDGLIQHAGMVTGVRRLVGTAFHSYPAETNAHFNMAQCAREVSLICGALLAMPAQVFRAVGGFDSVNTPISHSDVDLCFKVREAGLTCVYTPYATLLHIGHVSLAEVEAHDKVAKVYKRNSADIFLLRRWSSYLAHDPFFTSSMRDLIYLDSEGSFSVFPPEANLTSAKESVGPSTLIVSHDLTESGAPKVVFDLALSMAKAGDFVVVISAADGPYRTKLVDAGIMVIVDVNVLGGNDDSMSIARNFDRVIANTALCWSVVAALSNYTEVFWYIHEIQLIKHLADKYEGFVASLTMPKALWVGSERAARAVMRYGAKPTILEYGVEDATERKTSKEAIKVSLFGSFEPRKGQDLLVLAIKQLPADVRSRARFRLFGRTLDASFRGAVEDLARGTGEIEITCELGFERYREELGMADIVVVPSRDDTLPLVSLDALALGKALVCSSETGTSDYLEHNVSALLLKHNSPEEIAGHLQTLINDAEKRHQLGRGARAVFETTFTTEAFESRLAQQRGI